MTVSDSGHRVAARWLVLGAAFLWGTTATLARHLFRDLHVPAFTLIELRLAIAALLLGTWLAWRRPHALRIERRDWGYLLILGAIGIAGVQGSYYVAISLLGVGLAILLQYIAPALIVGFEMLRGAPVRGRTLWALAAALAGTALLARNVHPSMLPKHPLHWAVGFSSALTFAFYVIYSKRGLARYEPTTMIFYSFSIAAVVWACVTPPWRIAAAGYPAATWLMFVVIGVFSTLVPFALFNTGLRRLPASEVGILAATEPVVAVVSAALLLGELLTPVQYLGAMLVLAASILASQSESSGAVPPDAIAITNPDAEEASAAVQSDRGVEKSRV